MVPTDSSFADDAQPVLSNQGIHDRSNSSAAKKKTFPQVLHEMLDEVEETGQTSIVSWQPHGRSFRVHKPKTFVSDVMPIMFRGTQWPSFQRQLNLYGFTRISSGKDKGAYYHRLFLRGRSELCENIHITRDKGNRFRVKANPDNEPDFYKEHLMDGISGTKEKSRSQSDRFRRRFNVLKPTTPPSRSLSLEESEIIGLTLEDELLLRKVSDVELEDFQFCTITSTESLSEDDQSISSHIDDSFIKVASRGLLEEDTGDFSDDDSISECSASLEPIPSLPDDPVKLQALFRLLGKSFCLDDLDELPDDDIGWHSLLHSS